MHLCACVVYGLMCNCLSGFSLSADDATVTLEATATIMEGSSREVVLMLDLGPFTLGADITVTVATAEDTGASNPGMTQYVTTLPTAIDESHFTFQPKWMILYQ